MIATLQQIYSDNFFPEMNADWSKYPDNVGHMIWPGCFRCHDGLHKTEDKKMQFLHTILAQGSGKALLQLVPGGQQFQHPAGDLGGDNSCIECSNGLFARPPFFVLAMTINSASIPKNVVRHTVNSSNN